MDPGSPMTLPKEDDEGWDSFSLFHEKILLEIWNEFVVTGEMYIKIYVAYQQDKLAKKWQNKYFWALFGNKLFVRNQPKKLSNFLIKKDVFDRFLTMKSFAFRPIGIMKWNQGQMKLKIPNIYNMKIAYWYLQPLLR